MFDSEFTCSNGRLTQQDRSIPRPTPHLRHIFLKTHRLDNAGRARTHRLCR